MTTHPDRIVLAYSGGLSSSAAIPWLAGETGAEIVTITLDLGQGGELEEVRDRALASGAVRAHVLDVRDELARDGVTRALKADAWSEDRCALVSAIGRSVIARRLVEIARIEQARTVAHGAAGLDAVRIEAGLRAVDPQVAVAAPAKKWGMTRAEVADYARRHQLSALTIEQPYCTDATLWGRVVECVDVDLWAEPPESLYAITTAPAACPAEPAYVEVAFERGMPTAVNGVAMPLTELFGTVAMIAGTHGIGRIDQVVVTGNRRVRHVCEAPAAVVLHTAHAELNRLLTSGATLRFTRRVSRDYAEVVAGGLWFTPLREALDAAVDTLQDRINGAVRLKLFKGDCRVVGRRAADPQPSGRKLRVVAASTH